MVPECNWLHRHGAQMCARMQTGRPCSLQGIFLRQLGDASGQAFARSSRAIRCKQAPHEPAGLCGTEGLSVQPVGAMRKGSAWRWAGHEPAGRAWAPHSQGTEGLPKVWRNAPRRRSGSTAAESRPDAMFTSVCLALLQQKKNGGK